MRAIHGSVGDPLARRMLHEDIRPACGLRGARGRRLDLVMEHMVAACIHKSGETLSEDLFLADRDAAEKDQILMGRQIVWMILDVFKSYRCMAEQYSLEDLRSVKWLGDARIKEF